MPDLCSIVCFWSNSSTHHQILHTVGRYLLCSKLASSDRSAGCWFSLPILKLVLIFANVTFDSCRHKICIKPHIFLHQPRISFLLGRWMSNVALIPRTITETSVYFLIAKAQQLCVLPQFLPQSATSFSFPSFLLLFASFPALNFRPGAVWHFANAIFPLKKTRGFSLALLLPFSK